MQIKAATDKYRQQILETQIDKGKASVIAFAFEIPESTIILDDYKARKIGGAACTQNYGNDWCNN